MRMAWNAESPMIHAWLACLVPTSPLFRSTSYDAATIARLASSTTTIDDVIRPLREASLRYCCSIHA